MNWYESNPHGPNASMAKEAQFGIHRAGRFLFPDSFARGGNIAPALFAATNRDAVSAIWRKPNKAGGAAHIGNLERMLERNPDSDKIKKALDTARKGSGKVGMLGRVAGVGMGVGFTALIAYSTPGSGKEKARAAAGSIVGMAGFTLGAKLGATAGVPFGPVGMFIGAAIGALGGALGVDEGFQALTRIPDKLVERERSRRKLDWVGDKRAFQTERAATMRQQSMQMMNSGMMSARSMLGREGVMLHQ